MCMGGESEKCIPCTISTAAYLPWKNVYSLRTNSSDLPCKVSEQLYQWLILKGILQAKQKPVSLPLDAMHLLF